MVLSSNSYMEPDWGGGHQRRYSFPYQLRILQGAAPECKVLWIRTTGSPDLGPRELCPRLWPIFTDNSFLPSCLTAIYFTNPHKESSQCSKSLNFPEGLSRQILNIFAKTQSRAKLSSKNLMMRKGVGS